jgi:2-C-methyl-D-erythritol 4-phosphate cytidylyltransferase
MGSSVPKQYLPLAGRTVIEHTLERLVDHPRIAGVFVAVSEHDPLWETTGFAGHPRIVRVAGGRERCHSVMNALQVLVGQADEQDWVLVHDAARPCLRHSDLEHLIQILADHPTGGLLGLPVRDTMKRADAALAVRETVSREGLWHAFTPQMFRLRALYDALSEALRRDLRITDDASAMELAGHRPLMVEGRGDNIKITRPEDLKLATFYLAQQEQEHANRSGL